MDQQIVIYAYNEMLHINTDTYNVQKCYAIPRSQTPKSTYHMIPFIWNSRKDKSNLEWHRISVFACGSDR